MEDVSFKLMLPSLETSSGHAAATPHGRRKKPGLANILRVVDDLVGKNRTIHMMGDSLLEGLGLEKVDLHTVTVELSIHIAVYAFLVLLFAWCLHHENWSWLGK